MVGLYRKIISEVTLQKARRVQKLKEEGLSLKEIAADPELCRGRSRPYSIGRIRELSRAENWYSRD
jgi:hypothetical protein